MRTPWSVPKVSIYPVRDRYQVHWIDATGRHRIARRTLSAARELQRQIQSDLERGAASRPTEPWLNVVREYFAALSAAAKSMAHLQELRATLDRYSRHAEPTIIGDLTARKAEAFLIARREQPSRRKLADGTPRALAAHTVAKDYRNLSAFGSWCELRGYLASNPLNRVSEPRTPRLLPEAPETSEWVILLESIPDTPIDDPQGMHLLILLAVVTGVREAALIRAPLTAFDLGSDDTGQVGLLRVTDKGQIASVHGLPPLLTSRISARIGELPDGTERLFCHWGDFPRDAWNRLRKRAAFKHSFHSLRRAAAMRAAEAQAIATASGKLGHADQRVARENYLTLAKLQRAAASALVLPELPALPAYVLYSILPNAKPRPTPQQCGHAAAAAHTDSPA